MGCHRGPLLTHGLTHADDGKNLCMSQPASPPSWAGLSTSFCSSASMRDTRAMRVRAVVVLAAMPLLLGAWTLSSENHMPWNPRGKAVVKTPDGVSHVILSSNCQFGPNGLVRLRFGGKLAGRPSATTDMPYMQLEIGRAHV